MRGLKLNILFILLLLATFNANAIKYYAKYNLTMEYVSGCNVSCVINVTSCVGTASESLRIINGISLTNYRMTYNGDMRTLTLTLAKRTMWYLGNINATRLNGLIITMSTNSCAYPGPYTSLPLYLLPMTLSFSANRADVKYVGNFYVSLDGEEFQGKGNVVLTVTITRMPYGKPDLSTGYLTVSIGDSMIKEMITLVHTLSSITVSSIKIVIVNGINNVISTIEQSIVPVLKKFINNVVHLVFPAKVRRTVQMVFGTWAMGVRDGKFSATAPVLILTLSGPSDLNSIYVAYSNYVICYYKDFALSADDTKALKEFGAGLTVSGYYGSTKYVLDDRDLSLPGGIVINITSKSRGAGGSTNSTTLPSLKDSFATVVAGTWEVSFVGPSKVETYFNPTSATITFLDVSSVVEAIEGSKVRTFDAVRVRGDRWSLVIWCNKVNVNLMDKVEVLLLFNGGGYMRVTVPLLVQ